MGELHLYKREEENEEKSQAATWSSRGPCMTTELSSGDWGVLKVFWEEERPYCFFPGSWSFVRWSKYFVCGYRKARLLLRVGVQAAGEKESFAEYFMLFAGVFPFGVRGIPSRA